MRSRAARTALLGTSLLAVGIGASPAWAAAPPPCPPGIASPPAFTVADAEDPRGDTRLTATHAIRVSAEFPLSETVSVFEETAAWAGPAGVPRFTDRSRGADDIDLGGPTDVAFQPATAGPLPVTLSWQQSDGTRDGRCSASASTTPQIVAARRARVRRPEGNLARRSEHQWTLEFLRDTDLRPVEVRLRSVRVARFPGPRVRFRTARRVLRPTDAGTVRDQTLFAPLTRVHIESVGDPRGLIVTFSVRGAITNPRLGFELEVRQPGRRLLRVRGAGRCSAFGCVFSRFSLR